MEIYSTLKEHLEGKTKSFWEEFYRTLRKIHEDYWNERDDKDKPSLYVGELQVMRFSPKSETT